MIHLFELIVTSMPCKHKQVEMGLHHCFPPHRPLLLFLFLNPVASFEDSGKLSSRESVSLSNSFVSIAVHEGPDVEDDDWPVKLNAVNSLGFFVGLGVRNVSRTLFLIGVSGMSRESTF